MRQFLESIRSVNMAQTAGGRQFEAHVFLDGAVKGLNASEYSLQLVSLVETVLGKYSYNIHISNIWIFINFLSIFVSFI